MSLDANNGPDHSGSEPWRQLPPEIADLLEPELGALSEEILEAIPREVPEYARPFEGAFGRGIQTGVTEALRQFLEMIRAPDSGREPGREIYVGLGRGEMRQGRSLDSLQAAYRIGARVAWRRLSARARAAGIDQEVVSLLAESIFAYIDELSSESVEGYASEQSLREGARERERRRLLALLTTEGTGEDPGELQSAAAEAGWVIPGSVAALACDRDELGPILRRLPGDCLGSSVGGVGCVAIPDPDGPGRLAAIESAVRGRSATLGLSVPPDDFARSWREAAAAYGALEPEGLLLAEDHLFVLILAENRPRLERIAAARLAAFEPLTPKGRTRMTETLAAFLSCSGETPAIAARLHVHPQTVRYRLGKLRELLGSQLDDPLARLELHAALRAGCLR